MIKHSTKSCLKFFEWTVPCNALQLTCCLVHRRWGRCWEYRTLTVHWRTGLYAWKKPQLKDINKTGIHHILCVCKRAGKEGGEKGNRQKSVNTYCCWQATLPCRRQVAALWGYTCLRTWSAGTHTAAADTDVSPDYCYWFPLGRQRRVNEAEAERVTAWDGKYGCVKQQAGPCLNCSCCSQ